MRTISDEQESLINDALAEGATTLSAAALEKDALLTEALRAISGINIPGLKITFSGGTCLSKAYGLLERMSEDIDLRLEIDRDQQTRSALRRSLRALKASMVDALRAADFALPDAAIKARNENQFVACQLGYTSRYGADIALRPEVLVEFTAISPRRPTELRLLQPLIDQITRRSTAQPVNIACLAIEETFCEKILSYLRRATEHVADRKHSQYDERLARHAYDVHQISTIRYRETDLSQFRPLFSEILTAEVEQYGNRLEAFRADPVGSLRKTLGTIAEATEFREHYKRFVGDLVYGPDKPTFEQAFGSFRRAADHLLGH